MKKKLILLTGIVIFICGCVRKNKIIVEASSNPYILIFKKAGQLYVQITQAGEYELTWSDGKKIACES